MSKKHEGRRQPDTTQPIMEQKAPAPGERCTCCGQLVPNPGATPQHLRCPRCANGVGQERWHARKGNLMRRCYACNLCGFDWSVDCKEIVEPIQIKYQEITIQTR